MNVVMIGPFGLKAKSTMRERALPMARALVRRGHTVTMVVPPWDSPEDAGQSWDDQGVKLINTLLPHPQNPLFHLKLTRLLVNQALSLKPDVIHLFKPKAYAGLAHLALHLLREVWHHRARLVVDEDDLEQAWNKLGQYSPMQRRLFAWQEPWGLTHADAVTVASKMLVHSTENYGVPLKNIHYIPNGVRVVQNPVSILKAFSVWQEEFAAITAPGVPVKHDPQPTFHHQMPVFQIPGSTYGSGEFEGRIRRQYDLPGYPLILLYTRFFEFRLGFLMRVAKQIHHQLPEAHWLVVGQGYFAEEKRLAELAKAEGLAHKFTFAGWVSPHELPHYFAAANVAVFPYDDTPINRTKCSVKLIDLLAAGVPVVASNVGQNAEYVLHGKTGFVVPPHSPRTMAQAVVVILTNRALQRAFSREAAHFVNHRFNWDLLVEQVEAAYKGLPQ